MFSLTPEVVIYLGKPAVQYNEKCFPEVLYAVRVVQVKQGNNNKCVEWRLQLPRAYSEQTQLENVRVRYLSDLSRTSPEDITSATCPLVKLTKRLNTKQIIHWKWADSQSSILNLIPFLWANWEVTFIFIYFYEIRIN